jgi:uncharacterized protein YrzB (UPF0473 family)
MKLMLLASLFLLISCQEALEEEINKGASSIAPKVYEVCANDGTESIFERYIFFTDDTLQIRMVFHSDVNCSKDSEREVNIFYGKYSYNKLTSKMTEHLTRLEVAFPSIEELNSRNSISYCGLTNWQLDMFKNITDNDDCVGGTVYSGNTPHEYNANLSETTFETDFETYNRVQ